MAKITDIKFQEKNLNKGTQFGDHLLEKSIERFGFREAGVLDKNGKIISGNHRAEKSASMGIDEVEIIKADPRKITMIQYDDIDLDTQEGKELALALNQTAKANIEIDFELAVEELGEETAVEWGLEPEEENKPLKAEEDDFDTTPPETPKTVLGDLYTFEKDGKELHRLLCGDSTDSEQVARLMNGEKADMVFTDPPYNVNYGNIKHPKFKNREIENDNMGEDDFRAFCQGFASNIKIYCKGVVYCWAGPGKDGRIMFTILDKTLHNSTLIVWNKDQFTLGRGKYQNKHELCWFGWNEDGGTFTDDRNLTNVWDFERPKKSELHPTMKPIRLIENALNHNPKAKSVLDLFFGSGSTMVAAHQLNRKCYGMELDEKYCDVIVNRMKALDPDLIIKRNGIEVDNTI